MAMIDVRRFLIYHGNKQKNMTNEELISILRTLPMNAEVVDNTLVSIGEVLLNELGQIELLSK